MTFTEERNQLEQELADCERKCDAYLELAERANEKAQAARKRLADLLAEHHDKSATNLAVMATYTDEAQTTT